jgi:hypothetical protein
MYVCIHVYIKDFGKERGWGRLDRREGEREPQDVGEWKTKFGMRYF